MSNPLRVLFVEDVQDDVVLANLELRRAGYEVTWERVETADQMVAALEGGSWDLVLADYSLPQFSGPAALELCRARGVDLPFIVLSGSIGEREAVESMKAGAGDFLAKGNLARLGPAVARELRDAAERKARREAERQRRMAEERYRVLVEQIPAALYIAASQRLGSMLYVSPQIEAMLGFHPDEWTSDAGLWARRTHPEDRARADADFQRLRQDGRPATCEYRMLARDGRQVWVRDEARLLVDHATGRPVVQGILQDVTRQRRAEEEMGRQRELLHQTEKVAALGQLLAGVAHELNNPLSVVMGQAALLRRALGTAPEAARAEKIENAAERCARIVRNFLSLARHEAPQREPVSIAQTVEAAVELLAYPLRVDGVEVKLDLQRDAPTLWADGHQLQQVLINLLSNAQYALRGTSPPRVLTISTRHDADRRLMRLDVADNGPGIPPSVMQHLFEPFYTTKPAGEGTGLGLSLCKGIVESHGGTLTVDSTPSQGSRFRIQLPIETPRAAAAQREPVTPTARPCAILVVDDERAVAELLTDLLQALGHQVEIADSGLAGLTRLESRRFDLIITDMRMPGIDGPGLFREVTRRHPHLERRFVFVTGDTLAPGTLEFLSETGLPHLTKPFELKELERVVSVACNSSVPADGSNRDAG